MTASNYADIIRSNLQAAFKRDPNEPAARLEAEPVTDEEFPANVTCLFAANADRFLPTDALADVREYTSRALIAALG